MSNVELKCKLGFHSFQRKTHDGWIVTICSRCGKDNTSSGDYL